MESHTNLRQGDKHGCQYDECRQGGKHTPTRDEKKKGCLSTVNVGKK